MHMRSMQGWRRGQKIHFFAITKLILLKEIKNIIGMEDAHTTKPDLEAGLSFFGVFNGHRSKSQFLFFQ